MNDEERMIEIFKEFKKDVERDLNKVAAAVGETLKDIAVPKPVKYMALQLIARSMREKELDDDDRKMCDFLMMNATTIAIHLPKKRGQNNVHM